jgi:serine protease
MRNALALTAAALVLAACQDASDPLAPARAPGDAPLLSAGARAVPGQYVVVLEEGANPRSVAAVAGVNPRFVYTAAVNGFAAQLNAGQLTALRANPAVAYVEEDAVVSLSATQSNATWGIDRIDQAALPLSTTYTYTPTGAGVRAYILDTGIRLSHAEFIGRASSGFDAVDGGSADDCNGHGTHVAGTVGGTVYGVAKGVSLVAVRVLDCAGSGTTAGVIAGIDWVTQNAVKPAVANMSLGGGASSTLDAAVSESINSGVTYALAAGNGDFLGRPVDACTTSPARVAAALTVGSTTSSDNESSFSNYGTCVDILAPGSSITSAWYQSDTQTSTISGTSMATPHVAGAAALYLQTAPSATPAQVANALISNANLNRITLHSRSTSGGTPNRLLYTAFLNGGTPIDAPPVAVFTFTCSSLSCSFDGSGSTDDNGVTSYAWSFGDGGTATGATATHSYAASGTYTVTLTVTDTGSQTGSTSSSVAVTSGGGGGITLSAAGYKVKGSQTVDLTWSGAAGTSVDVYRDGVRVTTTANDGAHTDPINRKGGGSYVYRVCEAGTSTCSGNVTVTF